MRKSKMASSMGVLGGVSPDQGIVPPAAAAAAHAIIPENNPVLQRLLSDEELGAIKHQRMVENPPRVRQHNHYDQTLRDTRRSNIDAANKRRGRQAKSVAKRHKREGEAFRLGRAAPLTAQEEAHLLGSEVALSNSPTSEELGQLEDVLNKTVNKELAADIEAAKPRNMATLPTNPAGEEGGVSLVSNTLGKNPRTQAPKTSRRRRSAPVLTQPPLVEIEKSSAKPEKAAKKSVAKKGAKTTKKASK